MRTGIGRWAPGRWVVGAFPLTLKTHDSRLTTLRGTIRRNWRSVLAAGALGLLPAVGAHADRNVLAPRGTVVLPDSLKLEFAGQATGGHSYLGWAAVRLPEALYDLELEAEMSRQGGRRRNTFSLQYPLTSEAFSELAPAISVGLRDVLNRGHEGRAFFMAATKTFGLSRAQEHWVRDVRLHAGYGSSRLDGAFVGVQARFTLGFSVNAEYVGRRFNAALAVPLFRNFNLKAYTLDGDVYYGAAFVLVK